MVDRMGVEKVHATTLLRKKYTEVAAIRMKNVSELSTRLMDKLCDCFPMFNPHTLMHTTIDFSDTPVTIGTITSRAYY